MDVIYESEDLNGNSLGGTSMERVKVTDSFGREYRETRS